MTWCKGKKKAGGSGCVYVCECVVKNNKKNINNNNNNKKKKKDDKSLVVLRATALKCFGDASAAA